MSHFHKTGNDGHRATQFLTERGLLRTRVDLHRPKMLIIQFHTLSLWKNASHTNFTHFCKMNLIEFQKYLIGVLVSKLVSLH